MVLLEIMELGQELWLLDWKENGGEDTVNDRVLHAGEGKMN